MSRMIDVGLVIIALVVLAANFEGLTVVIGADEIQDYLMALLLALGVGTITFLFWKLAFHIIPDLVRFDLRIGAWVVVVVGAGLVQCFSAYWTTTAIAGRDALAAHDVAAAADAERKVAMATQRAGGFSALIPRVATLSSDLKTQAECERQFGCVTGSPGQGGIGSLLDQIAGAAAGTADDAVAAQARLAEAGDAAKECLIALRAAAVNGDDPEDFASSLDCVNAALGDIANIGAAQQLALAMSSFADGIVIPVNVTSDQQIEAAKRLLDGVRASANAIANAAAPIAEAEAAVSEGVVFERLSAMQAVLQYASSILPAIFTAIALDLAPVALLALRTIHSAASRDYRENQVNQVTIGDVRMAMKAHAAIRDDGSPGPDVAPKSKQLPPRDPRSVN